MTPLRTLVRGSRPRLVANEITEYLDLYGVQRSKKPRTNTNLQNLIKDIEYQRYGSISTEVIQYSSHHGGVAQLGEHLPCKQGVRSSILLISTMTAIAVNEH